MRISERHAGFTLIGLLFLLAGMGVAMAALGVVWQTHSQREKEAELLFIGEQYRQALASFRRMTPGTVKQYPANLEDLLSDPRFPNTVRHLRRIYRDPMTGSRDWGLQRDQSQRIVAVFSLSQQVPLKKAKFPAGLDAFTDAASYRDWVFTAIKESTGETGDAAQTPGASGDKATPAVTAPDKTAPAADKSAAAGEVSADPCLAAYRAEMAACQPYFRGGDMAQWRVCTAATLTQLAACRKANRVGLD